jgi:putative transposase
VDFVRRWSEKTEIGAGRFIRWLDITASKFYGWRERYGRVNEHNGWVPPGVRPRVISDNGPQFIAKDFKEFIRISGMTHVRTSPYYPQSNGKIERWHKSLKGECIRPGTPLSLEDARRLVKSYVEHYNNVRLNSAIGYIAPKDMLAGHQQEIQAERDRKLETAREQRGNRRHRAA